IMKGLSECKSSESNIRRTRVKDIVKEVKDYLKTYSSAGMDISEDPAKDKEITIVKKQVNELVTYQEEGGSILKMPKLKFFITLEGTLFQEELNNKIKELNRISDLKAQKDKSEQELRKFFNQATLKAQAKNTDPLPITKISYTINSNKEATMKITRGDNYLNLIIHPNFRLKSLGFSEWLENQIKVDSEIADEMFKKMIYVIEAMSDCIKVMKGLSECKSSESNIRRTRVKDIVKEVEDYLKTYSSAGMDISEEIHCILVPAFWFLRFVSYDLVLRFGPAFCLKTSYILPKDKLRFAARHVAFCCKARCVLLQDSLSFALRHLAFCFKARYVLLQSSLRFASRHAAFCFKTSCVLSQDSCVLSHGAIANFAKKESMKKAFQDMLHELGEVNPTHAYCNGSRTSKDNEDPSFVDVDADPRVPLILGRSFLKTGCALIDVYEGELTLRVGNKAITFDLDQTSRYFANYDAMSVNRIDLIDVACEEYSQEVLGFLVSGNPTPSTEPIVSTSYPTLTSFEDSNFLLKETDAFLAIDDEPISPEIDDCYYDSEGDILLFEEFLNDDPSSPPLPPQELKVVEPTNEKSYIDEPPMVELKDLPPHLEYAFLEGDDKLPIINAIDLKDEEKTALIKVLKSHKKALAWQLSDIKGVDPEFYTHKILREDDFKPAVQHQRRVNPKIHETMEVFMDDFSVIGNSFGTCLSHLDKILKRCEDTNLYLNWDKSHFMVKEGIVLGHKISKNEIEVDKAKVDVITKLPHPTTARVEVTNRGLKRILKRTVGENRASWSDKLEDALWAFRTAYKTSIGCTPDRLVYGKACHLPLELEHKAYWALKHAYENSLIYKEQTKKLHDDKIKNRIFNVGDQDYLPKIEDFLCRILSWFLRPSYPLLDSSLGKSISMIYIAYS
nr:reverse transcriptase domain-containing protein [Tanacetum cinerariifolium]